MSDRTEREVDVEGLCERLSDVADAIVNGGGFGDGSPDAYNYAAASVREAATEIATLSARNEELRGMLRWALGEIDAAEIGPEHKHGEAKRMFQRQYRAARTLTDTAAPRCVNCGELHDEHSNFGVSSGCKWTLTDTED